MTQLVSIPHDLNQVLNLDAKAGQFTDLRETSDTAFPHIQVNETQPLVDARWARKDATVSAGTEPSFNGFSSLES